MPARKLRHLVGMSQNAGHLSRYFAPVSKPLCQVRDRLSESLTTPYGPINHQLKTIGAGHGKMLRPALVLLTGLACGGVRQKHIELAAVIELIHTATLLHDDVIDQAACRRNHPTVNRLYGNTAAVLLGDFLLSRAFETAVQLNLPFVEKILTRTAKQICQGELLQNIRREDWAMSQQDYLGIIEAKTAGLFSAACRLGASLCGKTKAAAECFAEYGRCVGMAFQITDDILDITGDVKKVGKTLGTDFSQRKPTLPVICFLKQQKPAQKKAFLKTFSTTPDTKQLARVLSDGGSLDYARNMAVQFIQKAVDAIASFPSVPAIEAMKKIATVIGKRA